MFFYQQIKWFKTLISRQQQYLKIKSSLFQFMRLIEFEDKSDRLFFFPTGTQQHKNEHTKNWIHILISALCNYKSKSHVCVCIALSYHKWPVFQINVLEEVPGNYRIGRKTNTVVSFVTFNYNTIKAKSISLLLLLLLLLFDSVKSKLN